MDRWRPNSCPITLFPPPFPPGREAEAAGPARRGVQNCRGQCFMASCLQQKNRPGCGTLRRVHCQKSMTLICPEFTSRDPLSTRAGHDACVPQRGRRSSPLVRQGHNHKGGRIERDLARLEGPWLACALKLRARPPPRPRRQCVLRYLRSPRHRDRHPGRAH